MSRRLVAAVLACTLTLAGCTTMTPVRLASPGEPPFGPVTAGDTVVVQTQAGETVGSVVQRIDGETLVASDGRRYERADLRRVERKAVSRPKTAGLIAGIAGGVLLGAMLAVGYWLGENSR